MDDYNPDKSQSLQDYIIEFNKDLHKKYNELLQKNKELEVQYEQEQDDHDSTSKKLPYLRGLLKNEYLMRKEVYDIFLKMKEDRKHMVIKFNRYAFFKNLLFIVVLASMPLAWGTYYFLDRDTFALYLTLNFVLCLYYFIALPHFVFEGPMKHELPENASKLLTKYKEHVRNTSYLEELLDNC